MRRLATQHLLPREGRHIQLVPRQALRKGGGGGIADRQALPVGFDPVAVRHAHPRGSAVPCKHHVVVGIDRRKVHDLAILGGFHLRVELELLDRIGHPARTKALPGEHFHRPRAQQRPHRHLHRAGIRRGHDANPIVVRDAENLARAVDGRLEPRLAHGGAMRAPERRVGQHIYIVFGELGAGARGKTRIFRPRDRLFNSHFCYPSR